MKVYVFNSELIDKVTELWNEKLLLLLCYFYFYRFCFVSQTEILIHILLTKVQRRHLVALKSIMKALFVFFHKLLPSY